MKKAKTKKPRQPHLKANYGNATPEQVGKAVLAYRPQDKKPKPAGKGG